MQNVIAGVDVGGTLIKIGLADDSGRLLSSEVLETEGCRSAESLLDNVAIKIEGLAKTASASITRAGIGCPGRIDVTSGKIVWLRGKLEFLEGFPLARRLGERLVCPVTCDNDVNTILAGEMRFGAGRGRRDVVAVTVGTGIGGALVLGGRMVRGRNWATGHVGFMSLDPQGPRHVCGNTGIVEEFASQSGFVRQLRRALKEGEVSPLTESLARGEEPGLRELFLAADAGDPLGRRLADRLISDLGALIANLIYVLDPELVLVGGGIVNHHSAVLDLIRREVAGRIDFLPPGATEILPMALGDTAGVLGGVALAMDATTATEEGLGARGEEE